jgi:hypothetical protein
MRRLAFLSLLATSVALAQAPPPTPPFEVALEAGKMHEVCARLAKGDKRRYHWKATAPVDFNIHYHEGNEVFYPVKRDLMRGDGGTFVAKIDQDYCWMWTARQGAATVSGQVRE